MRENNKYKVGNIRPSQLLFTYGIGAIAELPQLSVLVMGLDQWLIDDSQVLYEPRLLAAVKNRLGNQVTSLRRPPIVPSEGGENVNPFVGVPVAPFPSWMVCSRCRLLAPLESGLFKIKSNPFRLNDICYVHANCQGSPKYKREPAAIPARFLVACSQGHLDDFPWLYFVHRGNSECTGPLKFEEYGSSGSTTEISVKCTKCADLSPRILSDAFGESGKTHMPRCRARNPHLNDFDEKCSEQMSTMLLGASNSWFPLTLSVLSLPENSSELEQLVKQFWSDLSEISSIEELKSMSRIFAKSDLKPLAKYPTEEIWQIILNKKDNSQHPELEQKKIDLKSPEWEVFSQANVNLNNENFRLRPVEPPAGFTKYFSQIVLVEKLREFMSLVGFSRIQSSGDFGDEIESEEITIVPLSSNPPQWVPSCETRGEGIFIQFNESTIQAWEDSQDLRNKASKVKLAYSDWLSRRNLNPNKSLTPSMRYLLLHSLSHALIRQFSIACGYSSASLRERIYSKKPDQEGGPQAGILIYTAASDSEGTMGGLVSLGESAILGYHISQALEQVKLCASDPLCAEHDANSQDGSLHWAACHSCLFTPETSCEKGNKFLDRSLLVKTLANSDLAFFE
jgi:hypothetical protein